MLLRRKSFRAARWKNGGGTTEEIASFSSGGLMLWRLSVATIERDGPFSDFSGYDRTIIPLDGEGIILSFAGGSRETLNLPFVPFAFAGERKVECSLVGGPAHDLNVMTLRTACEHDVAVRNVGAKWSTVPGASAAGFIYVLDGTLLVLGPGDAGCDRAESGDAVRLPGDTIKVRAEDGAAKICVIRIGGRGDGAANPEKASSK